MTENSNHSSYNKMNNQWEEYSYFPIKKPHIEKYAKDQLAVFWVVEDINFSQDSKDFEKLKPDEQRFIKFVLAFFAQADGLVNENLMDRFQKEMRIYKEANHFYVVQAMIEQIHNETYSLLVTTLISNPREREQVLNGITHFPAVKKIAEWMMEWMRTDLPLTERLIAMACVEGIIFSSAFAAIYWIKKKNILLGLCKANEFIARDEALHTKAGIALYHELVNDRHYPALSDDRVREIVGSAVELTEEFTRDALKVDLIGMNADDMMKYVKCTANRLISSLTGQEKTYDVENPFLWMVMIALPNKSNFFETKVSEYAKHEADFTFDLNAAF